MKNKDNKPQANNNKTKRVTRVEIIDETGRAIVMTNLASVKLSLQDDERTLKLFVTHKSPTHASARSVEDFTPAQWFCPPTHAS